MSTSSTNNPNQSNNNNNSNNNTKNNSNERNRKREDQTVSTLRYDWQMFISKMIHLSSSCKADYASNPIAQQDIQSKAKEVLDKRDELKKSIGKMESIIRGREEEIKGLVLDRGSAGVAGRKRRRRQTSE